MQILNTPLNELTQSTLQPTSLPEFQKPYGVNEYTLATAVGQYGGIHFAKSNLMALKQGVLSLLGLRTSRQRPSGAIWQLTSLNILLGLQNQNLFFCEAKMSPEVIRSRGLFDHSLHFY